MFIESEMPSNHLSSIAPFSSRLQSFPASGSFPVTQLLALGGQSIGVLASASVLPMNIQGWFHLGWTGWISFNSRDSQESSLTPQFKSINSLVLSFIVQLSHLYMTTGKTIALTRWTLAPKVMSLLFNMLSRLVIAFLPRSKCLLISWLQSPWLIYISPSFCTIVGLRKLSRLVITFLPRSKRLLISWLQSQSAVILEPKKMRSLTVSIISPSIWHEVMGLDAMIFVFWMLSFKTTFFTLLFHIHQEAL